MYFFLLLLLLLLFLWLLLFLLFLLVLLFLLLLLLYNQRYIFWVVAQRSFWFEKVDILILIILTGGLIFVYPDLGHFYEILWSIWNWLGVLDRINFYGLFDESIVDVATLYSLQIEMKAHPVILFMNLFRISWHWVRGVIEDRYLNIEFMNLFLVFNFIFKTLNNTTSIVQL